MSDTCARCGQPTNRNPLAILTRVLHRLPADIEGRVKAIDLVRIVRLTIEECER